VLVTTRLESAAARGERLARFGHILRTCERRSLPRFRGSPGKGGIADVLAVERLRPVDFGGPLLRAVEAVNGAAVRAVTDAGVGAGTGMVVGVRHERVSRWIREVRGDGGCRRPRLRPRSRQGGGRPGVRS